MTGSDVYDALVGHYEETGRVMNQTTFINLIATRTETDAIIEGVSQFNHYLDWKRQTDKHA